MSPVPRFGHTYTLCMVLVRKPQCSLLLTEIVHLKREKGRKKGRKRERETTRNAYTHAHTQTQNTHTFTHTIHTYLKNTKSEAIMYKQKTKKALKKCPNKAI